MTDRFDFTRAGTDGATLGQDGSDLLIVNNGDGSDFLETSLEAAGLEVIVAAATTETAGGADIDTVQVNGVGLDAAEDDIWIDGAIVSVETGDAAREAAGLEVIVAAATTEAGVVEDQGPFAGFDAVFDLS